MKPGAVAVVVDSGPARRVRLVRHGRQVRACAETVSCGALGRPTSRPSSSEARVRPHVPAFGGQPVRGPAQGPTLTPGVQAPGQRAGQHRHRPDEQQDDRQPGEPDRQLTGRRGGVAGERHPGGRVERHPADVGEPHLGPGVRVAFAHNEPAARAVELAGGEPRRQSGRHPDLAQHDDQAAGDLLAPPDLGLEQEVVDHVDTLRRQGSVERVLQVLAHPVLEGQHLGVLGGRSSIGHHPLRQLPHPRVVGTGVRYRSATSSGIGASTEASWLAVTRTCMLVTE